MPLPGDAEAAPFDDLTSELPYIQLLNRVLPPDIRIYAWCANLPIDFSARFSCKERRYKYFFTDPCFAPVPGSSGLYGTSEETTMREGHLDIPSMQAACARLIGLHDFRNFCKIDASKQITNFQRRIFYAGIEEVSPLAVPSFLSHQAVTSTTTQPKTYAFVLHGSAFLWHQVRSIVAILFLVGQRLERPELVSQLLDITSNPTRPKYEMASDAPLVLWDCIFPHADEVQSSEERETGYTDRMQWIYVGDEGGVEPKSKGTLKGGASSVGRGKWGRGGVVDDVWEVWRGCKIDETLAALLLDKVAGLGDATLDAEQDEELEMVKTGPRVFDGGNVGKAKGKYAPVMERERQEEVEVVNERYRVRKGWVGNKKPGTEVEEDGDE
jgi:tRNA pseudouridine38/39 synthase